MFIQLVVLVLELSRAPVLGATCLNCRDPKFLPQCSNFIRSFRGATEAHTATIWDPSVFGASNTCLRRFARRLPSPSIEIHLTCGPCTRSRAFPGYKPEPGRLIAQALRFCSRVGARCLISRVLEYSADLQPMATHKAPDYETVSNPIPNAPSVRADFHEVHGNTQTSAPGLLLS